MPAKCGILMVLLRALAVLAFSVSLAIASDQQLQSYHQLGMPVADLAWASPSSLGKGFLTYGPYTTAYRDGAFVASFDLSVDNNSADDLNVAFVDVYDDVSGRELARREIHRREFNSPHAYQKFDLSFVTLGVNKLEFRVYVFGASYVAHRSTDIKRSSGGLPTPPIAYTGAAQLFSSGSFTVTFRLEAGDVGLGAANVAEVDVYVPSISKAIARRVIRRGDFEPFSTPHEFDLVFENTSPMPLEFRVRPLGSAKIKRDSTLVRPDRLTLSALWEKNAHFEFRQRNYFMYAGVHDNDTSSLVALDGTWYAFNRSEAVSMPATQAAACKSVSRAPLQTVVRASTDRGATWSDPLVVAAPGSSADSVDGCEVLDGGAFFDGDTDTWHYLSQCIGKEGGWNLCHYSREGSSPLGRFDVDRFNPVVTGGALWGQICKGVDKACPDSMRDEGTPQVIYKSADGYFYVTFHGADYGKAVTGARGVARTADFHQWQVAGVGLPDDAMLARRDCEGWAAGWSKEGCIGEGTARIIRSGGRYYQLAEAADDSLLCQKDQNWVFGLLRNGQLGASGSWENYGGNPFVINQNRSPVGCALQYMNLFRDRGEIFLEFSLYTPDYAFPDYTYQLVDGATALDLLRVK